MHRGDGVARLRNAPTWLIKMAAERAGRLLADGFAAADSRGYHYLLLAALDEHGPSSQAELGRRCGIDRSDVVAAINEMAAANLVERRPDENDRRRNVITLTRAGSRHLKRLDDVVGGIQDAVLEPLSDRERQQLLRLLAKLVDHGG
ncbi:DNA-binding MarR family transcriptional regulator [Herbihabitans rhizosphaerae]|uniref:DNA-binding MarR family transcriptional regulator n=1 Tax=Herbihabitans rhizosphaerae TaxID=1872711 RepID=A0A4Q7L6F6_9PSEU|nr:MarR family transcriptional regulator [Herbihabitans rhizosphaerae]RZS44171.1 DNA-binding MarR family transcriptional regulator [Herbihabitans rhizosphaerae]